MKLDAFKASLASPEPPPDLSLALQALWWDARGDWHKAHERAQERDDAAGAHVHAYLHRKEGDQPNANYWYRRAHATPSTLTLDAEWEELVRKFLAGGVSEALCPWGEVAGGNHWQAPELHEAIERDLSCHIPSLGGQQILFIGSRRNK